MAHALEPLTSAASHMSAMYWTQLEGFEVDASDCQEPNTVARIDYRAVL